MSYAYRGEDGPQGGRSGRTPEDVRRAHGFAPWQAVNLDQARANLTRLVNQGTLADQALQWCFFKNRDNGWFFSTGLDEETAYDTYDYFYRIGLDGLAQKPWSVLDAPDVASMTLYLDNDRLDQATLIAVIWSRRPRELLMMSPVPVERIDLRDNGTWVPLANI